MAERKLDSAGDERTANNGVRHQYRQLDDAEKAAGIREGLAHRSGLVGTVDELKAVIEEYESVGVDEIVVPDFAITGPDKMRTLERFNTEVLGR